MGLRSLGILQRWELESFDQLMQLRPDEGPDQRLFLVTITERDVQSQPAAERGVASLSDRALYRLLTKLKQGQPRAIGLDIYRDYAVKPEFSQLVNRMQRSDRLVAICHYGNPGVPPPPEVKSQSQGFNNVLLDSDSVIRRQLLAVSSAAPCQNRFSFNFQLAIRYLKHKQISVKFTPEAYLQLGSVVFRTIDANTNGYYNLNASGHQVMLNYRATRQVATRVSLQEVLSDDFDLAAIRDRIVLVGTTDQSFQDTHWQTPYSQNQGNVQTTSGVEIQAHMVSQILSAVLDQRPLIGWLPKPVEVIWIGAWALTGGLLAYSLRSLLHWLLSSGMMIVILYSSCLAILTVQGGWIPLVPTAIAFIATGSTIILLPRLKRD
nr:CHASE2 domain-containing protein [Leptolyngbya sp. FACHB-36]